MSGETTGGGRRTIIGGAGVLAGLAALGCLMTGGCIPRAPEPAPPPPPPAPSPAPAPAPAITTQVPTPTYENWMDAPATPGDWRYRTTGATTRASFGPASGAPLFEMVCEGGARVQLIRQGSAGQGSGNAMRILAESAERALPAGAVTGGVAAQLAPGDSLLDAMAFSKGRFAVMVEGLSPLYLPAWPEVTRVLEDCR